MAVQDRPYCFECCEVIEHSPIFEAPCGHDDCRSAVFHGLCLMQFRERRESAANPFEVVGLLLRRQMQEHTEHEEK